MQNEPESRKPATKSREEPMAPHLAMKHLRVGWWLLLFFLTLGFVIESLFGFKVGWYLDVSNETRRLMWRLAHAHGTLLSLVHIAFASTISMRPGWSLRPQTLASKCLTWASLLLPGGFLLGGVTIYAGDPGLGILLVPVGAVCLIVSVLLTAKG